MNFRKRVLTALKMVAKTVERLISRARTVWPALLVVALLLVILSLASLSYALQVKKPSQKPASKPVPTAATSTAPLALPRALDGVLVHPSSTRLLPLAVSVENSADAWPLSGPAKADLVIEAPVEGGITRYLLFFDASTTAAEIGPVRSARPYFVDWAEALGAMYAHVGGSPASLDMIAGKPDFRDLNEFWNGWAFWRSASRVAPHNVFTRTEFLLKAADKKKYLPGDFRSWYYRETATSTSATSTVAGVVFGSVSVPYDGAYRASWKYDATAGDYIRYRNGDALKDADGSLVRAKNVVLILTDAAVIDDIGRLKMRTTGSGKALIFIEGQRHEAVWSRATGEHLRFATVDGQDVVFARGKTWVSVVTNPVAFEKVVP